MKPIEAHEIFEDISEGIQNGLDRAWLRLRFPVEWSPDVIQWNFKVTINCPTKEIVFEVTEDETNPEGANRVSVRRTDQHALRWFYVEPPQNASWRGKP